MCTPSAAVSSVSEKGLVDHLDHSRITSALLTGKVPFYELGDSSRVLIAAKGAGIVPDADSYTEIVAADPVWRVLKWCWSMDPASRPTVLELMQEASRCISC